MRLLKSTELNISAGHMPSVGDLFVDMAIGAACGGMAGALGGPMGMVAGVVGGASMAAAGHMAHDGYSMYRDNQDKADNYR